MAMTFSDVVKSHTMRDSNLYVQVVKTRNKDLDHNRDHKVDSISEIERRLKNLSDLKQKYQELSLIHI